MRLIKTYSLHKLIEVMGPIHLHIKETERSVKALNETCAALYNGNWVRFSELEDNLFSTKTRLEKSLVSQNKYYKSLLQLLKSKITEG